MSLSADEIEAIADLVAAKLAAQRPQSRYVDVRGAAAHLAMSEDWVRSHAAELGGARMGDGKYGELRFLVADLDAAVERRRLQPPPAPQRPRRRPGPRRKSGGEFELIPIPDSGVVH